MFELVAAANLLFSYVLAGAELEEAVWASGVRRSLRWDQDNAPRPLLNSLRDQYAVSRLDEHFDFGLERSSADYLPGAMTAWPDAPSRKTSLESSPSTTT